MKTRNIFKSLALAMLLPAMLLTTACSNEDDAINEKVSQEGYKMPITVNVTRQGDAATRATYNETTKKLSFSDGDKLFVEGTTSSYQYAGTLTWTSGGTFSGNLSVSGNYSGTVEEMLTNATEVKATLLPSDYGDYHFLSIDGTGYGASLGSPNFGYAIAVDLATAVEQFSLEQASSYDNGFALAPQNAIVNFTFKLSSVGSGSYFPYLLDNDGGYEYGGLKFIRFDDNKVAKFAIGVKSDISEWSLEKKYDEDFSTANLGLKELEAGHIYNYTNIPATGHALTSAAVGEIICSDGKAYAGTAYNKLPTGVTAVAKICYVSGEHGLALALSDEGKMDWSSAKTACEAHTPTITGCTWRMATQDEWVSMMVTAGEDYDLRDGFSGVGGTNMQSDIYWSSTETSQTGWVWCWDFKKGDGWSPADMTYGGFYARACLAF